MEILRDKYLNDLIYRMHNGLIKVITGLRRSGKSYLLFEIFKKYLLRNNVDEFCDDREEKESLFEKVLKKLGIKHIRTRPYSPWQNGVVERSHKIDNELFYSKRRFKNEIEMYKSFKRYSVRTNNIARRVLGFKTPNEMVEKFFNKAA